MHPSESLPGHPDPQTKMRPYCVPGPSRCSLHLLIFLLTKRGGGLGGHLAVSIRKHLLPGSVISSMLQTLLGPSFHKPPRAAVRRSWERVCRYVQDPDRLTLVRGRVQGRREEEERSAPPMLFLGPSPCLCLWVYRTKNSKGNRCILGGTINHPNCQRDLLCLTEKSHGKS